MPLSRPLVGRKYASPECPLPVAAPGWGRQCQWSWWSWYGARVKVCFLCVGVYKWKHKLGSGIRT